MNVKIKKLTNVVKVEDDTKAECCCHDCTEWYWSGKSCSRKRGCREKAKFTAKWTTWW